MTYKHIYDFEHAISLACNIYRPFCELLKSCGSVRRKLKYITCMLKLYRFTLIFVRIKFSHVY